MKIVPGSVFSECVAYRIQNLLFLASVEKPHVITKCMMALLYFLFLCLLPFSSQRAEPSPLTDVSHLSSLF